MDRVFSKAFEFRASFLTAGHAPAFECLTVHGPNACVTAKDSAPKLQRQSPDALLRISDLGLLSAFGFSSLFFVPADRHLKQFTRAFQIQLLLDSRSVSLDGLHVDMKPFGNLAYAQAFSCQLENLQLAFR